MPGVKFSNADNNYKLPQKRRLKNFIINMCSLEGKALKTLNYVFCSDEYLQRINIDFLQHDYYTDIITFDLNNSGEKDLKGEIYISIDRVKDNAATLHKNFGDELLRVMFHGVLHLCGYKDKKKSEITIMRQKEDYYLHLFSQTSPNE